MALRKVFGSLRENIEIIPVDSDPEIQKRMNQKMKEVRVEFLIKTGQMA